MASDVRRVSDAPPNPAQLGKKARLLANPPHISLRLDYEMSRKDMARLPANVPASCARVYYLDGQFMIKYK